MRSLTAADALIALQMTAKYREDADMNDDGRVTSVDAFMILQAIHDQDGAINWSGHYAISDEICERLQQAIGGT